MTATIRLSSSTAIRIGALVRLLGSDQPGEVVAAAGALVRALDHVGADVHVFADVVERALQHHPELLLADRGHGTPLGHSSLAHACWRRRLELTKREHDFVANMVRYRHPSVRQAAWLIAIADRLGVARTDYASRHRRN
jgi:hypothetical protein